MSIEPIAEGVPGAVVARRPAAPSASVVICAFSDERWHDLRSAVASIQAQTTHPREVVVVVDHNPTLLARVRREMPDVTAVGNAVARGAGPSRNVGVACTDTEVVAFLDDDAVAAPGWLDALLLHHSAPEVVGVGSASLPAWESGLAPRWFPEEFNWVVGASYRGMPTNAQTVRNVWTGGMTVRRDVFDDVGGFHAAFGKVGGHSAPEDTEFCIRAARSRAGGRWIYEPAAAIRHKVPDDRARFAFFLRRCYSEGRGKAEIAALVGREDAVSDERTYVRRTCAHAVADGALRALSGDRDAALRSIAIVGGLGSAAFGFGVAVGKTALARRRRR